MSRDAYVIAAAQTRHYKISSRTWKPEEQKSTAAPKPLRAGAFLFLRSALWRQCVGNLQVCRAPESVLHTNAQLPPPSKRRRNVVSSLVPGRYSNVQGRTESTGRPSNIPLRVPRFEKLHDAGDLAIYSMAEGAQLLIDRAMHNLDTPNPVEYRVKV